MNLPTLLEQHKTVICVFWLFPVLYISAIYLSLGFQLSTKIGSKWHNKNRILLFSQNFKPGRIRHVNLQRYAVNSKCQEYWQRIHKNSYSFYTKFVNVSPYNVLYKVQIFKLKNHEKKSKFWNFEVRISFKHLQISC